MIFVFLTINELIGLFITRFISFLKVQSCDRLLAIVHQARLRTIVRVGLSEAATELSSEQLRMEIASLQNKEIS